MAPGVAQIMAATFFFALMQICVKELNHLPAIQVVSFRAGVALILCVIQIYFSGGSFLGTHRRLLIYRGLAGTLALTAFFYTLHHMPLTTAVTLQYLSPLFTIILAGFMVGEKPRFWQWICFLVAFSGVYIIQGFDGRVDASTALIGVVSAFGSGLAYNIIRMLNGKEDPLTIVFYFPLVTFPLMLPFTIIHWVHPHGLDWLYLILVGVFTQAAQIFMTLAYQRQKAANIAIFNYLGIVYASAFGYVLFGEYVTWGTVVGVAMILASVIAVAWFPQTTKAN